MRLFIAIRLSDDMKKQLVRFMRELRGKGVSGSYAPVQNLHLTLCFIGETDRKEEIQGVLDELSWEPFHLSIQGMGRFGDLLWAGADGGKALYALAEEIRKGLDARGIPYDKKEFHPHITLLRRMTGEDGTRFPPPKMDMTVQEISLMRSDRVNGRMVYTGIYTA